MADRPTRLVLPDDSLWPVEVALYRLTTASRAVARTLVMAAMAISAAPMIVIFLVFQRYVISGVSAVNK